LNNAYGYDVEDRLTGWTRNDGRTESWNLSLAGDWNSVTLDGSQETRSHDAAHELTVRAGQTLSYDEKGNLTADTQGRVFTWDVENRLTGVAPSSPTNGSLKVAFQYDTQLRRIGKQVYQMVSNAWAQTSSTLFTWDRWLLASEISGSTTNVYIHGQDLSGTIHDAGGIGGLLFANLGTSSVYYAYNGNGNVAALTDLSGSVVARYNYSPYGKLLAMSGPVASLNHIRFSTKYWDDETGLGYWGYRYYDADFGRWLSRDPIWERAFSIMVRNSLSQDRQLFAREALRGERNLCLFVLNSPIGTYDSLGLQEEGAESAPPGAGGGVGTPGGGVTGPGVGVCQEFTVRTPILYLGFIPIGWMSTNIWNDPLCHRVSPGTACVGICMQCYVTATKGLFKACSCRRNPPSGIVRY
jgi:RHS repeat-associated protein